MLESPLISQTLSVCMLCIKPDDCYCGEYNQRRYWTVRTQWTDVIYLAQKTARWIES